MSKDKPVPKSKAEPSKKGTKISPADDLIKSKDIQLDEEELKRVTGGFTYIPHIQK